MGRKRLTKECTSCKGQCERKQFSRSMWEKEEAEGILCERVCRQCHFEIKKSREQATLFTTSGQVLDVPSANKTLLAGSATTGLPHVDINLFSDAFIVSPLLQPATAPITPSHLHSAGQHHVPGASSAVAGGLHARPRHNSTASSQLGPLNLEDEEFDQEFFDGAELETVFGHEGGDEKEKRSVRAKRRRAKMNALFSALASDVGLSVFVDRARVLERTREILRELREAKDIRETKRMKTIEPAVAAKPILSILDVVSEHLQNAQEQIVTHSHCA